MEGAVHLEAGGYTLLLGEYRPGGIKVKFNGSLVKMDGAALALHDRGQWDKKE